MKTTKILGIFMVLFLCGINTIGNGIAFEQVILDTELEYSAKVGDIIGVHYIINQTVYVKVGDTVYADENESINAYWKIVFNTMNPETIINGSMGRLIGFNLYTQDANPFLGLPTFTSALGWTEDEDSPKILFVNRSVGTMIELARFMIPTDITPLEFVGTNMTSFTYSLFWFIQTNNPEDPNIFESLRDDITERIDYENATQSITSKNTKNHALALFNYTVNGYKNVSQGIYMNNTAHFNTELQVTQKHFTELFTTNFGYNKITRNSTNDVIANQSINQQIDIQLVYDSDPLTFMELYWEYFVIGVVIIGGITAFFVFYYSKCKANPAYSNMCKIYRKAPPKSKKSDIY